MKNPDDISKLLGGYATGSLTDAEQRLLFEAALNDQQLFDALMEEQALKEAIESPGARERLLAAVRPASRPMRWWPKWTWVGVGAAALAAITIAVIVQVGGDWRQRNDVAVLEKAAVPAPVAPAPNTSASVTSGAAPAPKVEAGRPLSAAPVRIAPGRAQKEEPVELVKQLRRERPAVDAVTELPPPPPPETKAGPSQARMDAPQGPPPPSAPPQAPAAAPQAPQAAPQGEPSLAQNQLRDQAPAKSTPPPGVAGASVAGTLEQPKADATTAPVVAPQPRPRMLNRSFGSMKSALVAQPELAIGILMDDKPVPPQTIFHAGDTVRLLATPPFDGRLYVLRRDRSRDKWAVASSVDVRAGVPQTLPVELGTAGELELAVVLSRSPLADSAAADEARRDSQRASDRLVRKLRLTVQDKQKDKQ